MAEEKMISIEKLDEMMKDYFPEEETVDFHGLELAVRKTIGAAEMFELVRKVANSCFAADGMYMPEVYELALRAGVVAAYSNARLPENAEHMAQILFRTDLFETVTQHLNMGQYCALTDAVWESISARNNANKALFEAEIRKAVSAVESIGEQFSQLFDGLTQEDMQALIGAISNGGIDEEKLVQTVVEKQNALREQKLEVIEGGKDGE